jgi:hypothetical protein
LVVREMEAADLKDCESFDPASAFELLEACSRTTRGVRIGQRGIRL